MASKSYPRPGYNSGTITNFEHERLINMGLTDGLNGHPNDTPPVYADGTGTRVVKIRAGNIGYVRASVWEAGATDIALPSLAANSSGQPRIDLVVLRLDRSDYSVTERVITGVPAAVPVAPAPWADAGSTGYYDLPLAQVRVNSGVTALTADSVTNVAWYVGSEGAIRCKSWTRPPHQVGRRIFEVDTVRDMVSDGTSWLRVAEDAESSFTLTTGINANNGFVRLRNGWVFFSLTFWRPDSAFAPRTTYQLGLLPGGFRPPFTFFTHAVSPGAQEVMTVSIQSDGFVKAWTGNASVAADTSVTFSVCFPAR